MVHLIADKLEHLSLGFLQGHKEMYEIGHVVTLRLVILSRLSISLLLVMRDR